MRALSYDPQGGMHLVDRPMPVPSASGILVRVAAAGLNRADLLQRAGHYPAPVGWPADLPGLEYAGTVVAIGPAVTRWQVGDRVMGLVGGGGHAEYLTVDADEALAVPTGMSLIDAAALPEVFLTAWDALMIRGRMQAGERVLVHAVGSGVGTAAIQLAAWRGATVIGTSRSPDKLARARPLGLAQGVSTIDPEWPAQIGVPVDLVIDTLGRAVFEASLALLAPRGRLVALGALTGATGITLDLRPLLARRLEIIGSVMRSRPLAERIPLVADFAAQVLPAIAAGRLRPVIDRVLPFEAIAEAHDAMAQNQLFGKLVLTWSGVADE